MSYFDYYLYVQDQVRTLSQVGTKKVLEAGPFQNLLSHVGTITSVFVLKVIKRGFLPTVGIGFNILSRRLSKKILRNKF